MLSLFFVPYNLKRYKVNKLEEDKKNSPEVKLLILKWNFFFNTLYVHYYF